MPWSGVPGHLVLMRPSMSGPVRRPVRRLVRRIVEGIMRGCFAGGEAILTWDLRRRVGVKLI